MAKDAHPAPEKASYLPPLDVFRMPDADEGSTTASSPEAAPTTHDQTPLNVAPADNALRSEPAAAIEASLPPVQPVEPSTPSVVIDSASLDAELASSELTAPPDVPTVRLRSTRPPGKRLGREVLLAVVGMGFCLVLYGAGHELFGENGIPPAASTAIGAARAQTDAVSDVEHEPLPNQTEPSPPLEPLAEPPISDEAARSAAEPSAAGSALPAPSAATASAHDSGRSRVWGPSPAKGTPASAPLREPARATRPGTATQPDSVFDTPLLPPAE